MPNRLYYALLCTFAVLLAGNTYYAFQAYAMLDEAMQVASSQSAPYVVVFLIAMRALICALAISVLLLARKARTAQIASIGALVALIILALTNAPLIYRVISTHGLAAAAGSVPLMLSVVWLIVLLVAVSSNFAFQRKPLRGSAELGC